MTQTTRPVPSSNLDEVTLDDYIEQIRRYSALYKEDIRTARQLRIADVLSLSVAEVNEWNNSRQLRVRVNDDLHADQLLTIISAAFTLGGNTLKFSYIEPYGEQVREYDSEWIEKGMTIVYDAA